MNDDNTDDDDNKDDNNDNENNDNNNNKNNKIDYLQAGTSTSNGKGLFKSMFRNKINNIVNHINHPGSWEATTLKRCATSSSKRIGEKLKKKLSKKENFLILHKYFLQGNIMFYVTRF